MARSLTASALAEVQAAAKRWVIFVEIEFASGFVRVWSGIGDKSWDGKTWNGVGHLGGISAVEETGEVRAAGLVGFLSGIPSILLSSALGDIRRNKPASVWLGFLDSSGAVIADPYKSFSGRVDLAEIDEGAETATIAMRLENELIDLERPRERRYTNEDQQELHAGDLGFEFVPALQDLEITWGRA